MEDSLKQDNCFKNQYYLKESVFVEEIDGLQLWRLGENEFDEFNKFVFGVYSDAFHVNGVLPFSFEDIEKQSAIYYNATKICGIKHPNGTLLGTWGLVLKDLQTDDFLLPIENNFNLKAVEIIEKMEAPKVRYIFNGWRTAVDKHALEKYNIQKQKSIFLLDFLLRGLTRDFYGSSDTYLGVAEMEMLVYKYHRRIGIPWICVGNSIDYWGRDRYPFAFKMDIFKEYLREHHPERYDFICA